MAAQREMAADMFSLIGTGIYDQFETLIWAEAFARLAAVHGRHDDVERLAVVLAHRADDVRRKGGDATALTAEVVALVSVLGEAGRDDHADTLQGLCDGLTAQEVSGAREFVKLWASNNE